MEEMKLSEEICNEYFIMGNDNEYTEGYNDALSFVLPKVIELESKIEKLQQKKIYYKKLRSK